MILTELKLTRFLIKAQLKTTYVSSIYYISKPAKKVSAKGCAKNQ